MTLSIRVSPGDWGGAELANVEAVVRSAATAFDAYDADEPVALLVEPTPTDTDPPIALADPGPAGEFVVQLNARGNLWARLAFQFAHEYCHVIADPRTIEFGRFSWVEEALCETASLVALRHMERTWAAAPPYPNWREYSHSLGRYVQERLAEPAHSLPAGAEFGTWLAERMPLLEADAGRRDDNTIVARELLPLFSETTDWRALRYLHRRPVSPATSAREFMNGWAAACHPGCRGVAQAVAAVILIDQ